jgi:hypothetical protein
MGPVRIGACEVACPVMPRERNPGLKRTLDIWMRHPELDVNFLIRMELQTGWDFWILYKERGLGADWCH